VEEGELSEINAWVLSMWPALWSALSTSRRSCASVIPIRQRSSSRSTEKTSTSRKLAARNLSTKRSSPHSCSTATIGGRCASRCAGNTEEVCEGVVAVVDVAVAVSEGVVLVAMAVAVVLVAAVVARGEKQEAADEDGDGEDGEEEGMDPDEAAEPDGMCAELVDEKAVRCEANEGCEREGDASRSPYSSVGATTAL
jgi:hypothetical protein